jgi:hypothetical protein
MSEPTKPMMSFKDCCEKLGIAKYAERIFHSNSHGELFHLADYYHLAQIEGDMSWFAPWFEAVVKEAEEKWQRPESIFQHIGRMLKESFQAGEE